MQKIVKKESSKEVEVIDISKEIKPFMGWSTTKTIASQKEMTEAVTSLSVLNKILDKLTDDKEKITKPLNATLKEVRSRYKPAEDQLEGLIADVRMKMTAYQNAETARVRAEEAAIASRVGEGKGKIKMDTAARKMDEIDVPQTSIESNAGAVKFKAVPKFEVMDITLLPKEYVLADEVKIRRAMLAGIQVEGVRYYEDQVPYNSR